MMEGGGEEEDFYGVDELSDEVRRKELQRRPTDLPPPRSVQRRRKQPAEEVEHLQRRFAGAAAFGGLRLDSETTQTDGSDWVEEQYFHGAETSSLADNKTLRRPAAQQRGALDDGEEAGEVDSQYFAPPPSLPRPPSDSDSQDLDHSPISTRRRPSKKEFGRQEDEVSGVVRVGRKRGDGKERGHDALRKLRQSELRDRVAELRSEGVDEDGSLGALATLRSRMAEVEKMSEAELVELLFDSRLYEDDSVVAINKPYGLASQPGTDVRRSLGDGRLLAKLGGVVGVEKPLLPLQRLDKYTTGVMLFAKGQESRERLLQLWAARRVRKRYYALTIAPPPRAPEGIIHIPLSDRRVSPKIWKMVPAPDRVDRFGVALSRRDNRPRHEAVTEYRLLASGKGKASLLQLTLRTGVRHQIRAHLGLCLGIPILGDSKYTHLLQDKPQKPNGEICRALGIRQSKARKLPSFLHAHEILLPDAKDGRNLFIKAHLPKFFVYALNRLKIAVP